VTLRAPSLDDAQRLVEFLNAVAVDDGTGFVDEKEIRHWLTSANNDVDGNFRVFEDGDELLAYVDIVPFGGDAWLDVRVRPDLRGGETEDEALAWAVTRAGELDAVRAVKRHLASTDAAGLEATRRAGFTAAAHSFRMRIELDGPPEPARIPEGLAIRDFRPGEEREVWAAHQESFSDTEGHTEDEPYEAWFEDRTALGSQDPSLWLIAEDAGRIAGICLCRFREGMGWVGVLGVRQEWRGRGLGTALLTDAFRRFWERGESVVGLGVDGRSPNAVRLYERAGMHVFHRWDTYERPLT
jgi:ribosomal protein S18 acetylase RimI-like enzyme